VEQTHIDKHGIFFAEMRKRDLTWNGIQTRHRDGQLSKLPDCTESKPTHLIRQSESIFESIFPSITVYAGYWV